MPPLHADGTSKRSYLAPPSANNALQRFKYLGFLSRLEQIRQTSPSEIFHRVDYGLELIDMLINLRYSSGSMNDDFLHELFNLGSDALTLILQAIEAHWQVKAQSVEFEKWESSTITLSGSYRSRKFNNIVKRRPHTKDPRGLRDWAIENQLDLQRLDFHSPRSLDAGKEAIALCLCLPYTYHMDHPPEKIKLAEVRWGELFNDRADFGRRALRALAGFGQYLLEQFGQWECFIGREGFGVRRFGGKITGLDEFGEEWGEVVLRLSRVWKEAGYGDERFEMEKVEVTEEEKRGGEEVRRLVRMLVEDREWLTWLREKKV